jgi:hypothetical protein
VDGVPGDPEHECFPRAVRLKLDATGELTSLREEPIAADARPEGDGKEIAKQKIVAGLLGVGFDEIIRRAERAKKRRNRIRMVATFGAIIVVAAGITGWMGAISVSSRLDSSQLMNIKADVADQCEQASNQAAFYKVADDRRIALAVKCVRVLSDDLDELPENADVPLRFLSSFETMVSILQTFSDEGKLAPNQTQLLAKATRLATQFRKQLEMRSRQG